MAIGLTAKQKADLAAMLPNIEESVTSLKRLIVDAKDRTRALQKLSDAEEAQKRHANEVGIPFNADAFARRRAELDALPKTLTVEDGQLSAFTALQRAIGVVVEGPFERQGRGGGGAKKPAKHTGKGSGRAASGLAGKKGGAKQAKGKTPARAGASRPSANGSKPAARSSAPRAAAKDGRPAAPAPRMPVVKPLPLALGS